MSRDITTPRTLFDKLWDAHKVMTLEDGDDLLAIDRVFLHERTGAATLNALSRSQRTPIDPSRVYCIIDHIVSNKEDRDANDARSPNGDVFIRAVREAANEFGLNLVDTDDANQGITHVIAPELGLVLPGFSVICPDSHTCSLGALGALAWGVGSTAAEHAIATGTLRVKKPRQMRVTVNGKLRAPATAKDLALHLIATYGAAGGERAAIEFCGPAIDMLSVEERLTLCNMGVEFSAFTCVISPNETVLEYMATRAQSPPPRLIEHAMREWRLLVSDAGSVFDTELTINADDVRPMVTWGTSPEDGTRANGTSDASAYMGLEAGQELSDIQIDGAFIGSCTNGRISDLRAAAAYLVGQQVADGVRAICVPGSQSVKAQAELEGLDEIFKTAGFEWGAAGCAYCFYAGGDTFPSGARVISSTNRNFEGRQGPNVRTHLASPATVAASAVAGRIIDISESEDL